MEKKMWQVWDEFLVEAWMRDGGMFQVTFNFLLRYGIGVTYEQIRTRDPKDFFAAIGINSRSPKTGNQLHGPVKAFFRQFFPSANELLWKGHILAALKEMRQYKIAEGRLFEDKEMRAIKRHFRESRSTPQFPIIPGTNAMHISEARKLASDWYMVKPSRSRQRVKRL